MICRYHHGRVPDLLGAVLLRQHRCGLLQDVHPAHRLQMSHVARLFQQRLQPHHLLHLQPRVPPGRNLAVVVLVTVVLLL